MVRTVSIDGCLFSHAALLPRRASVLSHLEALAEVETPLVRKTIPAWCTTVGRSTVARRLQLDQEPLAAILPSARAVGWRLETGVRRECARLRVAEANVPL